MKELIVLLITWLPTALFAIIVLYQLVRGLMRGFSKSLKLFITFILSIIVAVTVYLLLNKNFDTIIIQIVNNTLSNLNSIIKSCPKNFTEIMNSIFSTYGPLTEHAKLSEYIEEILVNTNYFEEASQGLSLAEATKLLYSVSMLAVNLVLVILCILVYFLAKAIFYIFYLIFFKEGRREKRINKKYEEGKTDHKYKKKGGFGALIGLIRGLAVGLFVISIFGTVSILIPKNKEDNIEDESELETDMRMYRDLYTAIGNWSETGVTGLLNNMKTKDNLPYYLILSDKILSSEYTYLEDGETKTITVSLNDDLVPLTKSLSKAAYVFLMYGYDTNKSYTDQEMIDFICSDKKVDGYTLQDRIDAILEATEFGEYTNYLIDGLVRTYVSNVCKNVSGIDSDEYKDLEVTNKILYQLLLGENSIKTSEIIKGSNLKAIFNTFVAVQTHQDEINALSKVFDTNEEVNQKLAFGINKTSVNQAEETTKVFNLINDELKKLTFYSETRFQRVVTDIVIILLNEEYDDLDFTSVVTDESLYDVKWTESLATVFSVLQDVTDLVVEKEYTTSDELTDYLISQLKNKESKTVTDIKSLINTSAGSILLNSKAFNSIVSDSLTKMLNEILPDSNIEIINTNYASYTNTNGVVVEGELDKIIDSLGSTISDIYTISKDSTLTDNEKTDEMVSIISHDESLRDLIKSGDNYSYLVHTILSSVISNVSIDNSKDKLYVPASSKSEITYLNQTCTVIDEEEFTNMLDCLAKLTDNYSLSDFDDNDKYVDLIFDLALYVSNSNIIKANVAKAIYSFKDSANLSFTTALDLSSENIDKNMSNWIKSDGEVDKLIDVITYKDSDGNDKRDLIKSVLDSSSDYNTYLVSIINSIDTFGDVLFRSDVINATITTYLKDEDTIFVPSISYEIQNETIKVEEIKSMCRFVKDVLNISEETESIDFNSLTSLSLSKYNEDLDGLLALFDSNIGSLTLAYNVINNSNNETSALVVPSSLIFTKDDETNINAWLGNTGETKKLAKGIYYLGLLDKVSGEDLSFDEDKLLELDNTYIDIVFESDVFNATGALYFVNNKPDSLAIKTTYNISKDTIINDYNTTPLTHDLEVKKLILAVKSLGMSLSQSNISVELINKMNTHDDSNKSSLDYIIDSDILYYGLSDYIINSDNLKVSSSSIESKDNYNYVEERELHNFVTGVIALDLSNELSEFNANKLLTKDVDTMLKSNIIWYTLSDKLLSLEGIDILSNSIEVQNSKEIFVLKNEINNFTTAVKCITDDLDTIDVDVNTLVDNVETLVKSNIVRTSITQKVLESNDIVVKRVDNTVYASIDTKYNQTGNTETNMYSLTQDEIKNFVNAINTIYGETPSYDVDYDSIQINSIDVSILDSSVILYGLQTNISNAISAYNSVSTTKFDDTEYDIYQYTLYNHETKVEETKILHTKECVQAFKEVVSA